MVWSAWLINRAGGLDSDSRYKVSHLFDRRWLRCNVRLRVPEQGQQLTCAAGTSNRNTDCDYSSAYVSLYTDSDLVGHGMTFTIGRGNDIVSLGDRLNL